MARIPLRAYNREIADLIEHDQFDQAIAHCKHILMFFSKHIDTYRLLGKAYLESQRYGDAADVFQRVLSSLPEDFIAHLGMSVIREDEGNLDEAIWHMERAFEMQPANATVQGELRRLIGRRDGLEPPKIRLTRGALARMYVKGDLYPQAIAELRTALVEDPQRLDLQALLAHTYYLAGQKAEAAETSSSLLRKLPYCLEANHLLAQILTGSERAGEAETFRQRILALDPYIEYTSSDAPTPDRVPETNVTVERLDWKPGQPAAGTGSQPEWAASLGVHTDEIAPNESLPEWLSNPTGDAGRPEAAFDETQRTNTSGSQSNSATDFNAGAFVTESPESITQPPQVEIPDWMKDIGWEPSSGQAEESGPVPAFEEDRSGEEIAPAEIPDWLRSVAPAPAEEEAPDLSSAQEELPPVPENPQAGLNTREFLPWLSETQPGPTDSIINWLEEKSPPKGPEESPAGTVGPGEAEEAGIPEWIQGLGDDKSSELDYFTQEEADAPINLPDWLTGSEPDDSSSEIPDWLKSVADQPDAAAGLDAGGQNTADGSLEGAPLDQEPTAGELQEWLAASEALPSTPGLDGGGSIPDQTGEENPDWLKAMDQEAVQSDRLAEGESLEPEPPSAESEEGAFDWLEGLADRQGAGAALFPTAEEPLEPGIDWMGVGSQAGEELPTSAEDYQTLDSAAAEGVGDQSDAQILPFEEAELPDWMMQSSGQSETDALGEEHRAAFESETELPQAELPDWLQGLAPTTPLESADSDLGAVGVFPFGTSEESASPTEPGDIPDWLREITPAKDDPARSEDRTSESASQSDELSETPGWLSKLDEGPILEEDTKPTRISQAMEVSIPPELSEFVAKTAPEPAEDQAPIDTSTDAIRESIFEETAQDAVEEVGESDEETGLGGPVLAGETSEAAVAGEIPEWLGLPGEEPASQEEPVSEIQAGDITGLWAEMPPAEETPLKPGDVEQDSAFDWLDNLAAQQGEISSEPISGEGEPRLEGAQIFEAAYPEEPVEEMAVEEDGTTPARLFDLIGESAAEHPEEAHEPAEADFVETEAPAFMSSETFAAADEIEATAPAEPVSDDEISAEGEYELPAWLFGEGEEQGLEPQPRTPSFEAAAELEGPEEPPLEISAARSDKAPIDLLDLNQAALIDLERVPGIGLLGAQAILAYRESQGQFSTLEDLRNVSGFDEETILLLRDRVTVLSPAGAGTQETPVDWSQVSLIQARNALAQSSSEKALEQYSGLIKSRTLLPEVIQDLHEALHRFPEDVPLWQALGDAYARNDQLQDALDSYTKAEELLR